MSVQETILSFPGLDDFPVKYLSNILGSRSLDGAADSSIVDRKLINLAIADTLVVAVNMPDWTENKSSEKYPRDYFISTARLMYAANGEHDNANALSKKIKVPYGKATNKW